MSVAIGWATKQASSTLGELTTNLARLETDSVLRPASEDDKCLETNNV